MEFRNALQIAPTDSEARYENGVVDEKLGNPREAAQFYQGAIDVNKDNVRARAALGRLYLFAGAPDKALETIDPGFTKHPDDAGLLTVRAAARVQLKDPAGALADAERAVQLAPTDEDAVSVLSGIYKSQGNTDKAVALLQGAIKQIPGTVDLRLVLAQLYASIDQDANAEALLVDLVRLNPAEKSHRLRLAQFYARLNKPDEAERILREGIKSLPKERELKTALVDFLAARRSREAAEKELNGFIAQYPKDYQLRFALAQFYEQGKDVAKAEAVYREVIAAAGLDGPGIAARDRLAALRMQQNDVAGAQKLIAEVLAKVPRDDDALILRGNLALAQKDPKTAIADLRAVLRDQPNAVGVMRALARAHLANGEPALAEETMRRAVDTNATDVGARLDLVKLLIQVGKPEQAKPLVETLIKQQPNNIDALAAQFQIAVAQNDPAGAKAAADAIVATNPKLAIGYYYQGAAAERDKRFEDAVRLYSAALEIQPEATEPLQSLTRVLVSQNRAPEALKRLDDIASRFARNSFAPNLKGELLLSQKRTADAIVAFKAAGDRREPKNWASVPQSRLAPRFWVTTPTAPSRPCRGRSARWRVPNRWTPSSRHSTSASGSPTMRSGCTSALRRNPKSDVIANNLAMLLVTPSKDPASLDRANQLSSRRRAFRLPPPDPEFLDTLWLGALQAGRRVTAADGPRCRSALVQGARTSPDAPGIIWGWRRRSRAKRMPRATA